MGVKCWNHVINSYSKLYCIFYSLTFGVDMKYMSMLDIWKQTLLCFSCSESVQRFLHYTFVSLFALVLLLSVFFPTKPGLFYFQDKIDLFTCHEWKTKEKKMEKKTQYDMVLSYHIFEVTLKRGIDFHVVYMLVQMPNKYECQNSSAGRYEYSLNIINHCHFSECKWYIL